MKRNRLIAIFLILLAGLTFWAIIKNQSAHKQVDTKKETASHQKNHEDHQEHDEKEQPEEHGDDHDHEGEDHGDHAEHGEHEEEEASVGGVGKNNAVTAADEHDGIRLSERAIEAMGIKTIPYKGDAVPRKVLVQYQDNIGIYRLRDGWFKLVSVEIKSRNVDPVPIFSKHLEPGDQVAVSGMGLLRAADLDAFSGEVGHSH